MVFASQGRCEDPSWALWTKYAAHFIDSQGRVLDRQQLDHSTSEGQAYAMFFAVVANDRASFDRLQRWTENNLCAGDMSRNLPAWHWGRDKDSNWRVLDANSASDADLWMAYALLEGGRLWQAPRYVALADAMLHMMEAKEVIQLPGVGAMLLPGTIGFHPSPELWIFNPSYLPVPVLLAAARAQPKGPWRAIAHNTAVMLSQASPHGFAMDWVSFTPEEKFCASAAPGEPRDATAKGSYDAIRVYLWTGLSQAETPDFAVMLRSINGMAQYMDQHLEPPAVVDADGNVLQPDAGVGFSAALVPYLSKTGRKTSETLQRARLDAHLDEVLGLYGNDPKYYDQNLALFALGWSDGRYSMDPEGRLKVRWKR